MILLTVTDLVRQFDAEPVLNRATFDVRDGDRIGLVGPNGAGKTTLLRILEQHRGRLTDYPGNFSKYWQLRHERQSVAQKTFEKQQEYIEKTEEYIRKNMFGQLSKQAKDREQKLARVEVIDTISNISGPTMSFAEPTRTGDWVIDAEGLTKGFIPGQPLFTGVTLQIKRGERWGILGPNGAGKTTLLRTLLGELKPDSGRSRFGTGVNVAYFDQQLLSVDPELDAMEAIRTSDVAQYTDGQLRDLLAKFGVKGELALQQVGAMSGGERSKVALARIAALKPNVLILDEPTNHLDLWSRDALEQALKEFDGTLLFVSHDRYFLDQIATNVLVVEPGHWACYDGNYSDYVLFLKNRAAELKAAGERTTPAEKANRVEDRRSTRESRPRRKFPYRKVDEIEAEIADKEAITAKCEANLSDPAYHRDAIKMRANMELYESTKTALASLYEHWEEAVELN